MFKENRVNEFGSYVKIDGKFSRFSNKVNDGLNLLMMNCLVIG